MPSCLSVVFLLSSVLTASCSVTYTDDLRLSIEGDEYSLDVRGLPTVVHYYVPTAEPPVADVKEAADEAKTSIDKMLAMNTIAKNTEDKNIKDSVEKLNKYKRDIDTLVASYADIASAYSNSEAGPFDATQNCTTTSTVSRLVGDLSGISSKATNLLLVAAAPDSAAATAALDSTAMAAARYEIGTVTEAIRSKLRKATRNLRNRNSVLNSLANYVVPGEMLGLLDSNTCLAQGAMEHTTIRSCSKYQLGFACEIEVLQSNSELKVVELIPIPFWLNGRLFVLDLGYKYPVHIKNVAKLGNLDDCTEKGGIYKCSNQFRLKPNACLEHLLATEVDTVQIGKLCDFKQLKPNDEPFIAEVERGVLIAQQSHSTVIVQLGQVGITADPVFLENAEEVEISYGNTGESQRVARKRIDGESVVHTCAFNNTVLESIVEGTSMPYGAMGELLSDKTQEVIALVSLALQLIVLATCIPLLYKEVKPRCLHWKCPWPKNRDDDKQVDIELDPIAASPCLSNKGKRVRIETNLERAARTWGSASAPIAGCVNAI